VATVDANVRRKTMTGALSRLTKDSIVTTNLHSNNVQGMFERSGRASTRSTPVREKRAIIS
jgi:phosphoribosylpyrophosphate synthetase